jgi:hypothetical protein
MHSTSRLITRSRQRHLSLSVVSLVLLFAVGGCTGSPETLALRPDFEITTASGVSSVSMREPLPGLTDEHFTQLIKVGMSRAALGSVQSGRIEPPFPTRRIVWHVNPIPSSGVSRLVVNIFDGSVPIADAQEVVANSAPDVEIIRTIESMTEQLMASDARHLA